MAGFYVISRSKVQGRVWGKLGGERLQAVRLQGSGHLAIEF